MLWLSSGEGSGATAAMNRAESATFKLPEDRSFLADSLTEQKGPRRRLGGPNATEGFLYGKHTFIVNEGEAYFQSVKGTSGKAGGCMVSILRRRRPATAMGRGSGFLGLVKQLSAGGAPIRKARSSGDSSARADGNGDRGGRHTRGLLNAE